MRIFSCKFGSGVSCFVEISDEAPVLGKTHILNVRWTGRPKAKDIRPYIAWMNSVNQQCANDWNMKIMHIFLVSKFVAEAWGCEPNCSPRLIEVIKR